MKVLTGLIAASAAAMLLSACSSTSQNASAGLPRMAAAPRLSFHALFVADRDKNAVIVLRQPDFKEVRDKEVTDGINSPRGSWVDNLGNLYVVNEKPEPGNITEYDSELKKTFTYNSIYRFRPVSVRTDGAGNVYEVNLDWVVEFAHGTNNIIAKCGEGGSHYFGGVAVDKQGDVFVSDYDGQGPVDRIREYPKELGALSCDPIVLPITTVHAEGMVVDQGGNLVVCDRFGTVDIIAPPYDKITGTFGSGTLVRPIDVTIDKSGTQAYVTDEGARVVQVFSYPSGTLLATLGSGNGLAGPVSAVDSDNFIP